MADDILLTQEEQDEKAKQWLKDNGLALAIGIALGLGGIFGYNAYKASKQENAEAASNLFSTMMEQVSVSDNIDIDASVNSLKTDYASSSYAAKAALIKASQLAKTDIPAALTEYQWVIDNANELGLRHAASIRKAKLHVSLAEYDQAKKIASQESYKSFASHYKEILGDIAVQQGELDKAYDYYQQATEQLSPSDAAYASILSLKMVPLPKPEDETIADITAETEEVMSSEADSSTPTEGSSNAEGSMEAEAAVEVMDDVMQDAESATLTEEVTQ